MWTWKEPWLSNGFLAASAGPAECVKKSSPHLPEAGAASGQADRFTGLKFQQHREQTALGEGGS